MLKQIKPYIELMRLHQPVGIFLLLWPCLISLNMANRGNLDITLYIVFIIGSIVMRAAGCIFNDLVDKDFDKKVERTKNRPLANGQISKLQAIKLLVGLLFIALSLLFFLSKLAIIICFLSIPLIAIYPFCKRFTYLAQLWLGITFNLGALVAWTTIHDKITLSPVFLYLAMILWTLGYDTIYAHQDKEDDLKLGLKSTAILLGDKTAKYVNLFYTIMITFIIYAFGIMGPKLQFFALMSFPVALLFWQVSTLDINDRNNCARRFKANILVGALIFIASLSV